MASLPTLTIVEQSHVSPPQGTIGARSLPLTFFDLSWLSFGPTHNIFFYEFSGTKKSQFIDSVVPNIKHSLSITLQHFFPFVGNLIIFPSSPTKSPEIRYIEGDFVAVTFAECTLNFNDLVGNNPRACDMFYPLIPPLGHATKVSDYVTIPLFSVQVTFFPNCGISIGMTTLHCLADASAAFCFLKAWTSIARSGTDETFLANGPFPLYDRVVKYPRLDEIYIKKAKLETFANGYQPKFLSGPTNNVRATFLLTQTTINQLKKLVHTKIPTLQYVSSLTVACAYIWSCFAKTRNDVLQQFGFVIDCRARLVPPIPSTYFGNCTTFCAAMEKTNILAKKEGFETAAKLLGECLHDKLNDKEGILKDAEKWLDFSYEEMPTTIISIAGTPKLKFYDMDFGWGKPRKYEMISIDYNQSISLNASRESDKDLEIGVCLSATEMEAFVAIFNEGLQEFV